MNRLVAVITALALSLSALPAHGQGTEPAPGQKLTLTQGYGLSDYDEEIIKASVLDQIYDPASARFTEIRATQDNYGNVKVCGMINSRDEAGRMSGQVPFLGALLEAPQAETEPPAAGFELIAIGGEACPVCLTFGNRNVPSIACWQTGRNPGGQPGQSSQPRLEIPTPGSLLGR